MRRASKDSEVKLAFCMLLRQSCLMNETGTIRFWCNPAPSLLWRFTSSFVVWKVNRWRRVLLLKQIVGLTSGKAHHIVAVTSRCAERLKLPVTRGTGPSTGPYLPRLMKHRALHTDNTPSNPRFTVMSPSVDETRRALRVIQGNTPPSVGPAGHGNGVEGENYLVQGMILFLV